MSTATTTSHDTGQHTTSRTTPQPTPRQPERSASTLRTTMAAAKLDFTWLGDRKTLDPEQRTTAARAFHADRELLSANFRQAYRLAVTALRR
jgi:hypothetical protein